MIKNRTRSIMGVFTMYSGMPLVFVLLIVVGLLTSFKIINYYEERAQVMEGVNRLAIEMEDFPGDRIHELEAIRRERVAVLNRSLIEELGIAAALLLAGMAVPLLLCRHLAGMVKNNLALLGEHLGSSGRERSALMPHAFDFKEFEAVLEQMRQVFRQRSETEQRWKRAEQELVAANSDLMRRAEELKQGRKVALSMMEDAELARQEAEKTNIRLQLAIEQARQSAREADVANRAKSDFLATMSHEIRTPLNGVIGFIDLLSDTPLDEEQQEYVNTVKTSSRTLMALINDILDFSKIESGHLNLEVREFNLVRSLREVVALFFGDAVKKNIQLSMEIRDEVPRKILGDEMRIQQIITNLVANAVKFTETGEIRLIVSANPTQTKGDRVTLEFEVRDTGIGMSKEQVQKLFQPFSQGDSSTTRKYGGTGLGLAICKRLAEAMGGKISATSEVGRGSSFFTAIQVRSVSTTENVTPGRIFPQAGTADGLKNQESELRLVHKIEAAGILSRSGNAASKRGKPGDSMPLRIVVAEDNIANQRVLKMILRRLGWTAEFKSNGSELVEYMKAHPCDLVLMDLQMPVMDGLEATQSIRAGSAGELNQTTKIIALTANALAGDEVRCLKAGMDAYVTKPIKVDHLEKKILSLFEEATA